MLGLPDLFFHSLYLQDPSPEWTSPSTSPVSVPEQLSVGIKVTGPIQVTITIKSQLQISMGGLHGPAILLLFSRKFEFPFFPTTVSLTPFAPCSQKTTCCRHCMFVLVDEILILFQWHGIPFALSQQFLTCVMWIFKGTQKLSKGIWVNFSALIHLKMLYWSSILTSLWQLPFFDFIEEIHAFHLFKILLWELYSDVSSEAVDQGIFQNIIREAFSN